MPGYCGSAQLTDQPLLFLEILAGSCEVGEASDDERDVPLEGRPQNVLLRDRLNQANAMGREMPSLDRSATGDRILELGPVFKPQVRAQRR